jgi:hypothetical protein
MPLSLLAFIFLDAPVGLAMIMNLPLIPATLYVALNAMLLHDFGKAFDRKIKMRHYITLFATQVLYQIILSAAALWAVVREFRGDYSWEKTAHTGQHRLEPVYAAGDASSMNFNEEGSDA